MRPPFVEVLEATDSEKDRYAYELAMFVYKRYKAKQQETEQMCGIIEMDKIKSNGNTQ